MAMRFLQRVLALTVVAFFGLVGTAQAPNRVWVQIEAHPNLATAEARVRAYSQLLDNVNGFRAVTGLYAVALGPYDSDAGSLVLQQLLGQGLIPRDSFLEDGDLYATQFFPVGTGTLQGDAVVEETTDEVVEAVVEEDPAEVVVLDEPPQEARQSEAQLTREDRDQLQVALQWFGFYNGRIDGAFDGEIAVRGIVVIGEQGRVTCEQICANTVVISGSLKGNITAHRVEITTTGRVWGDVVTIAFSTEEGAFLGFGSTSRLLLSVFFLASC